MAQAGYLPRHFMAAPNQPGPAFKFPFIIRVFRLVVRAIGLVAPEVAARMAYRMWFKPDRGKLRDGEPELLVEAGQESYTFDGLRIAVQIWGSGPVVLLVHGWSSRGSRMAGIGSALAEAGFQALAFDAPAHGDSEGWGTSGIQIAALTKALAAEYGPFTGAVTHSFGGIAVNLACRDGLTLDRLVCISPPADAPRLMTVYLEMLRLRPAIAHRVQEMGKEQFGDDIWERLTMYNNPAEMQLPALVVHDHTDRVALFSEGEKLAASWPNARLLATDGLGHRRILRDPDVIASVVAFIAGGS